MIISASRRTDIPAFYTDWLLKRIEQGYVAVRNPFNYHQIYLVDLRPENVDCIVFWTKDPTNILPKLHHLSPYAYYFQITLNAYDQSLETNVPKKSQIIKSFKQLADKIGNERVIWRYDPILLSKKFTIDYHVEYFAALARTLKGYTQKCVISFLDLYRKTQHNLKDLDLLPLRIQDMHYLAQNFVKIANDNNLSLETCAEEINFEIYGIKQGKCIDDKLISHILGTKIEIRDDKNQRPSCRCASSIDIGAYNTCLHNCLYCYANYSKKSVAKNVTAHNVNSPLLIGEIGPQDKVIVKKEQLTLSKQLVLFKS